MSLLTEMTNEQLLLEYVKSKDRSLKNELVMRYVYIVKIISKQLKSAYISFAEADDMINEGVIALMGALDTFSPEKNVKFESYASMKIRGAIIDVARKQDWVPRSVRKAAKDIDNAVKVLFERLGRFPEDDEIADFLEISIEKYNRLLGETSLCNILSLSSLVNEGSEIGVERVLSMGEYEQPHIVVEQQELAQRLKCAIEQLSTNEQTIISLYYAEELNMKEISEIMNLSESRISQIHSKSVIRLRQIMGGFIEA